MKMKFSFLTPLRNNFAQFSSKATRASPEWTIHNYRYFLPIQTRFADNDHYNHVNNSNYHFFCDTVVSSYLVWYCGLSTSDASPRKIGYMVNTHCTYKQAVQFPQVLLGGLCLTKLGRSSLHYRVGIFAPKLDYMNLKDPKAEDPHLALGIGSQGLLINGQNEYKLGELGKFYESQASVLGKPVHVLVESTTKRPVEELPDNMIPGLMDISTAAVSNRYISNETKISARQ